MLKLIYVMKVIFMLTKQEAKKAIKEGVSRWGCELIDCKIEDDEFTITVKGTQPLLQIGKEYNWAKYSARQLELRVSRFCSQYANGKSYKFSWDMKLPV